MFNIKVNFVYHLLHMHDNICNIVINKLVLFLTHRDGTHTHMEKIRKDS
jgi:hypothetical protein